ncbi:succinate dehydrogenase / fumarate reductase, flavoprotein subunit [Candidatus Hakubella thermalkaliphila]|uniref:Succinate dehydrogenase / fumarate reductase, flavoprotein subunit n=1 Tax=Candidatus Hakubella thermalkaliphila TaxID=2754717 RepID=A0A6V8Q137_9ACTN|nr:FAD-binding protein [Candidatus Hakubella thermalkaliphila]GFP19121.1 succinate dehydrogenase / fumarate reductase, flavoprotein subunit [Candidatus Hakubella thermalkaliphila]GFP22568.1 succinate dehydrogenase / fumarate reductase, flavoprotein subunit [Candidatus Hakubella thermalkaliphila]GFP30391.1 succinate dehydrogenase / fumarate reductase, flavoprotein subunit [Candidatus Hakubella thermalkaliphila]GFP38472.1 succinate dehydrogenase / fumarate reductase, flavoprotein subunit [Candida
MYTPEMLESIKAVEKTRGKRMKEQHPRLTPQEKEALLKSFHPDFRPDTMRKVTVGPSKGETMPHELVDLLEARSRLDPHTFSLEAVAHDVEVLVIGGGGAGTSAAIEAKLAGANVLQVTKLRLGDANTMMAQGGIQAATKPNDSPMLHYLDVMGGGGFVNKPDLVKALVHDAPLVIDWLEDWGCMFSKEADGALVTIHGGGTCRKRMHFARDYTGAEIMRTLRDEARNIGVPIIEFSPAIELVLDEEGKCAGAVLTNLETGEYCVVRARAVILATGGFGRLHLAGFPTTNHYGATADGLVMAYRAGAPLIFLDATQIHPTGVAFPEQIIGQLVTEKVRGLGAQLVNTEGEQFVNPLETRDAVSSAIIRECLDRQKGYTTGTSQPGVWLDSPMIEAIHGKGTVQRELPAMYRQFKRFDIDMAQQPVLIYPTLHYQNGGVEINDLGETSIPGLFVAGECSGGVHGRNRLMGNSLLDILVFGRRAGQAAAAKSRSVKIGKLTLEHVKKYHAELDQEGIETDRISPMLLPDYTRKVPRADRG